MRRLSTDREGRAEALRLLRSGGAVALPTDTLYGLCADALDSRAVARVARIKGRGAGHPFPVLLAGPADLSQLVPQGGEGVAAALAAFWPGPLTLVVEGREDLPQGILGPDGGVGVRVPDARLVRELAASLGRPLTGTSANPTSAPPPGTAREVEEAFRGRVERPDLLLDGGPCPGGDPSTVLDVRGPRPRILRDGALGRERIAEALGVEPLL